MTARSYFTSAVTASPAGATETVIATLDGCTVSLPSDRFILHAFANMTIQAATTAIVLTIRRTSVSGTIVGATTVTPDAAGTIVGGTFTLDCDDTPGDVVALRYVLTATLTSAGGASTVNDVQLVASLPV